VQEEVKVEQGVAQVLQTEAVLEEKVDAEAALLARIDNALQRLLSNMQANATGAPSAPPAPP
jgi:hypothetical protein